MSAVKHGGEISSWFSVLSGTGQGDIQGPPVFNIVINWAAQLAECNKTVSRGLTLQGVESEGGGEGGLSW